MVPLVWGQVAEVTVDEGVSEEVVEATVELDATVEVEEGAEDAAAFFCPTGALVDAASAVDEAELLVELETGMLVELPTELWTEVARVLDAELLTELWTEVARVLDAELLEAGLLVELMDDDETLATHLAPRRPGLLYSAAPRVFFM